VDNLLKLTMMLSSLAVSHLAQDAISHFGCESIQSAIAGCLLAQLMPPLPSNRRSILSHEIEANESALMAEYIHEYRPDWSFIPTFQDVVGDGNCQDYCTLGSLGENSINALDLRVWKGVHYLQNGSLYQAKLYEWNVIDSKPKSFEDFLKICFKDYQDQDVYHDLATAYLLNRPVVIWYPKFRSIASLIPLMLP